MPSNPTVGALTQRPPGSLVCIVDDDGAIRRSLERLFRSAGMKVETFPSAGAYLRREAHAGPLCLVLDVRMPGLDGLELQKALADRDAQIVFITGHGDVPMCARAMKAGAVDFLIKPVDDEQLFAAAARALVRSAEAQARTGERAQAQARLKSVTPREREVMERVISGALNKQIADDLGAAVKTIKIHRGRVMEKMRATSVAELIRAAQAAGVVPVQVGVRA